MSLYVTSVVESKGEDDIDAKHCYSFILNLYSDLAHWSFEHFNCHLFMNWSTFERCDH